MKYQTAMTLIAFFGLTTARPTANVKREVPQEHSHEKFLRGTATALNLDNPDQISDVVFGLLGNAAASTGAGKITNPDCLHQATADRAFTNAKAAGDVEGMTNALVYAALERNTGKVGLASVLCTETAVNPEIDAISQHQDPASDNAAATNKAITLELAKQLASVGADPQIALQAGTFAPGDLNDNTGKGNTCDTLDDAEGCIFTQNLLVEDATAAEIDAAVAGVATGGGAATNGDAAAGNGNAGNNNAGNNNAGNNNAGNNNAADSGAADACPAASTVTVDAPAATTAPAAGGAAAPATQTEAATPATGDAATGTNVQTFTGSLGGPPPPVESSAGDRPFSVNGNTFVNASAALQRSCAIQNNACANAVNSKALAGSVSDCNAQESACNDAASA